MTLDLTPVRLFAFDFDGTLVDSNHIKTQSFFDVVPGVAEQKTLRHIMQENPGFTRVQVFEALAQEHSHLSSENLITAYGERCETLILSAPEIPGALALLKLIKAQSKYAFVNSATPTKPLKQIIKQLPLSDYIDGIYGTPETKTENLYHVLETCKLSPAAVAVIGDRANDQRAAQDIGALFIGIKGDLNDFETPPVYLLEDLTPLQKLL